MGKFISYDLTKQETLKKHTEEIENLKRYKPIFSYAKGISSFWSEKEYGYLRKERSVGMSFALGLNTIHCFSLDLYLGKSDSLTKDIGRFLTILRDNPDFQEIEGESEHIDIGWKAWKFKYLPGKHGNDDYPQYPILMIRAWFEGSELCKKVPTGKLIEEMKVICIE